MGAPASRHSRPAPTDFHPRSGFATPPSPSHPQHTPDSFLCVSAPSTSPCRDPALEALEALLDGWLFCFL